MLTREEILSKTKLKTQSVEVKEWAGSVLVSEMSGAQRDAWEQTLQERDSLGRLISPRAKLVIATAVNETGDPLFTEKDTDAIGKLSAASLIEICNVAQKLNKLMAEDLEEATKN
jgi:hypothetical protein